MGRAHCVAHEIDLIEIISDDGISAKSLDRPGLRRALWMLDEGKADAVVVVKLDRLTRSVKDLGVLCESYFGEGKPCYNCSNSVGLHIQLDLIYLAMCISSSFLSLLSSGQPGGRKSISPTSASPAR